MLYFAYGSNLYPPQMQARCPGAQALTRGMLENWQLILTKRGTANIISKPGALVHGGLWKFQPHHVAIMDRWEGVSSGVYRKAWLPVRTADGGLKTALTYVGAHRSYGRASPHYIINAMIPGALAFALPEAYLEEIRSWLPTRPIATSQRYYGQRNQTPKK